MRRASTLFVVALFGVMPLAGTGCVQQEKYDQLLMANRSLQEQVVALEDERDVARANLDTVREQLTRSRTDLNALKNKYGIAEGDLDKIGKDYDSLMKRVYSLDFGPLPEDVERALQQLADQHPELLSFDAKRGMLRFASDFTFALGSADLSSQASSSLSTLARILNSPNANSFEVRIMGHTDNVPIGNPATRAKHPTNWHLSAHRAISVSQALASAGIDPTRLVVAGCGEYRPMVPNPTKGGAAQNRRVEIFLAPMPSTTPATAAVSAQPISDSGEPMK